MSGNVKPPFERVMSLAARERVTLRTDVETSGGVRAPNSKMSHDT
jgi:hypothetical protein